VVSHSVAAEFGELIAGRMRAEHRAIAARWLERLTELLSLDAIEVFPGDTLLDHIPALVHEIAAYLRAPDAEAIAANAAVIAKAQELGRLRHGQRASVHQVAQEFRLLGDILGAFVKEETVRLGLQPDPVTCFDLFRRLNDCVGVLLQTTLDTFISTYSDTIEQQTTRLEGFNRMVSHELRQPLGTLQYAIALLEREPEAGDQERRRRLWTLLNRNVARILDLTQKLEVLSRLRAADDTAQRQRVLLSSVASEVRHQLREMAEARSVAIRIADDLPAITADAARLELVFMNLMSNAIKYSDPDKPDRFVEVAVGDDAREGECAVLVRDNGLGIPREHLPSIFGQFFRAHELRDGELGTEGLGLGLAIVADCLEALGGRISVESTVGEGTTFCVVLPLEPPSA
jgi:signal transduction histidine kinase